MIYRIVAFAFAFIVFLAVWFINNGRPIHISPDAVLPDGSKYSGEIANGKFHGEGKLTFPEGDFYKGNFRQGVMHGHGVYTEARGVTFEGEFSNGVATGRFEYTNPIDKSHYEGAMLHWMFHGQGSFKSEAHIYEGEFKDGYYHGTGVLNYIVEGDEHGSRYEGEFENGVFVGQGKYFLLGDTYEGKFVDNTFEGEGKVLRDDGSIEEGLFQGWLLNGQGKKTDAEGNVRTGTFENGYLDGEGLEVKANGERYEGNFQYDRYDGFGVHSLPDGSTYTGEFRFGEYHGNGKQKIVREGVDIETRLGRWQNGRYLGSGDNPLRQGEIALEKHHQLLDNAQRAVENSRPGIADVYFLAVAGDGRQSVFRREVEFVREVVNLKFNIEGREILLINHHDSAEKFPLATRGSIASSLKRLGSIMEKDEDILLIYLTSHGSKEHMLSLEHDDIQLSSMAHTELAQAVAQTKIKWKVIIISACYSGGFIQSLKDDTTLVITAADASSRSFGCSEDSEGTYFAKALFLETLAKNPKLPMDSAFSEAVKIISAWESSENRKPSNPQIYSPPLILEKLAKLQQANQ